MKKRRLKVKINSKCKELVDLEHNNFMLRDKSNKMNKSIK